MNAALVLAGAGLLCTGADHPARRRAGVLTRSGRLRAADGRPGPRLSVRMLAAVGAAAVLAVWVLAGPALGIAAAAVAATVWMLARQSLRRRSAERRQLAFVAAVRLVIAELDAGARPETALTAAAEVSPEHADGFRGVATALPRGDPLPAGADAELAMLLRAFEVAGRTGAALAGVLGHVADDVEHTCARRQRLLALTAGPRSSASMLALLPLLGLAMGASIGAGPLRVLFAGSGGRALCCCGIVLDALGVAWTLRIVGRAGGGA